MRIKSISLQNVKSYDEFSPTIMLQPGVNAIIGENGSGKSTLCEAVGFALFDFLHPYSQADFVREGSNSGKVSIVFESDHSNHMYRVERGVGQSKYDVFNVSENLKLSLQGKGDVLTWLKDELGVPASLDLQTLWKSSLGVPQGKFTNDFAETPTIRAQLFNPLLEVDAYRTLWQKMKGVVDVINEKKNQVLEDITRLKSLVEELPVLEKQVEQRDKLIRQTENIISIIKEQITSLEQEKNQLEAIKKDIEDITHLIQLNQEKQRDTRAQLLQTKKQFTEAKKAKNIVSNHVNGYETFLSNSKKLEKLILIRKEKEVLVKKQTTFEKQHSLYQEQLKNVEEQVTIAERSRKEMDSLKNKVELQKVLEEHLEEIKKAENEITRVKKEIKQVQEKISKFRKEFNSLQHQIKVISENREIAKHKDKLQLEKDELLQDQSIINHQHRENKDAIELLKGKQEPVCPTCNRVLNESDRFEIIKLKHEELTRLEKKQNEIDQRLQQISKKLHDAIAAEQEVKRLDDLKSMQSSIQQEADELKHKKEYLEEKISDYQGKISEKESLQRKLKELGNPKDVFQKAKIRYEDHKGKEKKRDQLKENLVTVKKKKNQVSQQLEEYEGLQNEIDEVEKKQKRLKESYELYLQHKDFASKVDFWRKNVNALQSSVKQIEQILESLKTDLSTKKEKFDEDEFLQLKVDLEEKKKQQARKETQISEWIKQKRNLQTRVSEKQKQKEKLTEIKLTKYSLEKDIEFAEFLRETYQRSRPLVTEILVEEISREADRIYRELRGVPSEELAWKKDYEIIVYDSGNKRAFHKLSGGEQMCAALAVRLAILKLLSTMDIVFLDEPTMNLDEEKKDNLVSQLRELSGFSQIFVISHDETFESLTEHVITLEKRQGSTRLLNHFQGVFRV